MKTNAITLALLSVVLFASSSFADTDSGIIAGVYGRIIIDNNANYAYTVEVFPAGDSVAVADTTGAVVFPGVDYPMLTYGVYHGSGTTYVDVRCTIVSNGERRSITHYDVYSVHYYTGAYVEFDFSADGLLGTTSLPVSSWAEIKSSF